MSIYKISSKNTNLVFIGSTGKKSKNIRRITKDKLRQNIVIGFGDVSIELLFKFTDNYTQTELLLKEREFLEKNKDNLVNLHENSTGYEEISKEKASKVQYETEPEVRCTSCCVTMKRRNLKNHNKTHKHIEKERNILNLPMDFPLDYRTVKVPNCTIV